MQPEREEEIEEIREAAGGDVDAEVSDGGDGDGDSDSEDAYHVNKSVLRALVRGTYDIQTLRISTGNRFIANFKAKLGQAPGEKEDQLDPEARALFADIRSQNLKAAHVLSGAGGDGEEDPETGERKKKDLLKKETVIKLWKKVREQFDRVTKDGKLPRRAKFQGDAVISDYTELSLISLYLTLAREEARHVTMIHHAVHPHPLWIRCTKDIKGCGPLMTAVLLSEVDIHKATTVAKLRAYAGLDVVQLPSGVTEGRGKREGHLVKRNYTNKRGEAASRLSITYNPFLKTKLLGVLAGCLVKYKGDDSPYKAAYYHAREKYEQHPVYGISRDKECRKAQNVQKKALAAASKAESEGGKAAAVAKPTMIHPVTGAKVPFIFTNKGRRHAMARRIMIKRFLRDVWVAWRQIEGLPITDPDEWRSHV